MLPSADLKSGNIDFDGSVMIAGNVMPLVEIKASGDIHVKGTVDNAVLTAGNDIIVGGGVLSESFPDAKEPPKLTTYLSAGNSVQAMYMSLTSAKAGKDIIVKKYVMHSELIAGNDITLGEGGGKGAVICGYSECGHSLNANIIGSNAYLKTIVSCGPLEDLRHDLRKICNLVKQRKNELSQLNVIKEKVEPKNDTEKVGEFLLHKMKKINSAISALNVRLAELDGKKDILDDKLARANKAFIKVNRTLFTNTFLTVNDVSQMTTRDKSKCKVRMKEGHLQFK